MGGTADTHEVVASMPAIKLDAATHRIVIVPNCSISVTGLWLFYISIAAVTLALAAWYTLHGFWPVLGFAILEMLALGLCLWTCRRHGRYSEVITVSGEQVTVDKGDGRHLQHREFRRYWAHLVVHDPSLRLHPARLFIRSHGEECEIGSCLTEAERESLMHRLVQLIGPVGTIGGG